MRVRRRTLTRFAVFLAICVAWTLAVLPGVALADDWRATLYNEGLPPRLVGVDKQRQTFLYFEKKSPFKLKYAFPCVTGQASGDKQVLNDLRTPEGIYFVEYKIANGLDFREYGGIAYTLNYPNPVDRLRGKTGHGIWIHSKGYGLVPTRGCVAIDLKDIGTVGPNLLPGTAVVLAEHMDEAQQPVKDNGTARELRRLHQSWSQTWAARSPKMFDFYDAEAYSKATENFQAFRANKERLFKMLSFIKLYNREIHALEGPGYWVTWSEQYYTASNLSTEGVRRLYWQRGKDRKFRIVGMEWTPRDLGMRADFQKGVLVAHSDLNVATDATSEAPTLPRLDMPEASDGAGLGRALALSEPLVPRRRLDEAAPSVNWDGASAVVAPDAAVTPESAPQAPSPTPAVPEAEKPVDPARTGQTTPAMPEPPAGPEPEPVKPQVPKAELTPEVIQAAQAFDDALANRSGKIEEMFDKARFRKVEGVPRGASYNTTWNDIRRYLGQPWVQVYNRPASVEWQGDVAVSRSEELVLAPPAVNRGSFALQGTRTLWWNRADDGTFRIVGMDFEPQELGIGVDYLENMGGEVDAVIEQWRTAWEKGDVEAYGAFYTRDAMQQGRRGAQAIMQHKRELWPRVAPTKVELGGVRLMLDKAGLRADMSQTYTNSSGHTDTGVKTLIFQFDGQNWRIAREEWASQ